LGKNRQKGKLTKYNYYILQCARKPGGLA